MAGSTLEFYKDGKRVSLEECVSAINDEIIALRARVARLEEALKFYAEKDYIEWVTKGSPDEDCYEDVDKGAVARRALEEK